MNLLGLTQLAQAIAKLKYVCIIQVMQLAQIGSGLRPLTRQFKLNQAHRNTWAFELLN
jgi:hypothetical protein